MSHAKVRRKFPNNDFPQEEVFRNQKFGGSIEILIFRQEEVCHRQKFGGSIKILFSDRRKYVATKKSEEVCHILEKNRCSMLI